MQRSCRVILVLFIFLSTSGVCLADLAGDVDRLLETTGLSGSTIGVSVRDCDSSEELVAVNANEKMIPASNQKLFTTGAALHVLGPDFHFRTRLLRVGDRLVIVGDGDPGFGDPQLLEEMTWTSDSGKSKRLDIESFLRIWVDAVAQEHLEKISEVIVDDRIFAREYAHPGWPVDQLNRRYCAEVAGLNVHLNTLHFFPKPRPGRAPDITKMRPDAPWIIPRNRASSRTGKKARQTVYITRAHHTNELSFYGNVKYPAAKAVEVTIHAVPTFFARLFSDRLENESIAVDSYRLANEDDPHDWGNQIGPMVQTSLLTALKRCNVDSQNLYAESLLKRTGYAVLNRPATWENATAVLRSVVQERLDDSTLTVGYVPDDGSGLSRENRIAPATMTAWLDTFHRDNKLGSMFIDSMAIAGKSGTVKRRFRDIGSHGEIVQCKTGYINQVSCLSGYVTMPDGRRRSFSILCNDLKKAGSVSKAKRLQESIVGAVVEDLAETKVQMGGG